MKLPVHTFRHRQYGSAVITVLAAMELPWRPDWSSVPASALPSARVPRIQESTSFRISIPSCHRRLRVATVQQPCPGEVRSCR